MLPLKHAAPSFRSFRTTIGLLPENIAVLVALRLVIPFGPPSLPERSTLTPVVTLAILRSVVIAIPRSCPDFEFVQLVPFRVGSIALRNGKDLANATTHIDWLHFIHLNIKPHNSLPFNNSWAKKTNLRINSL
jgi:hypothetical protein